MPKYSKEKTTLTKLSVFHKFNKKCSYCGHRIEFESFHVDHLIPKRRYKNLEYHANKDKEIGTNHIDNLMPSCTSCNSSKSDLSLDEFRERIYDRVKRLNNFSHEYKIAKRFGLVKEISKPIAFYFEIFNNGKDKNY